MVQKGAGVMVMGHEGMMIGSYWVAEACVLAFHSLDTPFLPYIHQFHVVWSLIFDIHGGEGASLFRVLCREHPRRFPSPFHIGVQVLMSRSVAVFCSNIRKPPSKGPGVIFHPGRSYSAVVHGADSGIAFGTSSPPGVPIPTIGRRSTVSPVWSSISC